MIKHVLRRFNHNCVNSFINDFTLPRRRVHKQFCQVIRVRPAHSLNALQLSSDVNFYSILQ